MQPIQSPKRVVFLLGTGESWRSSCLSQTRA